MNLIDLLNGEGVALEVEQGESYTYAKLRQMVNERAFYWRETHDVSLLHRGVVVILESNLFDLIVSFFAAVQLNMVVSLNGDPHEVCADWTCSSGNLKPIATVHRDYAHSVDVLFLTSGTTCMRRVVGHRASALLICAQEMSAALSLSHTSRVALPLSLSFHYGFSLLSSTFLANGTLLLPASLPDEPLFMFGINDWLISSQPTVLAAVPQGWDVYTKLLSPAIWKGLDTLITAGDLISSDTLQRMYHCNLKTVIHILYGSTEVLRTCHRIWEPTDAEGCIGSPLPSVRLTQTSDCVFQSGDTIFDELWEGEQCIRAPSAWMLTDTLMEREGVWHFLHRNADMLKIGGERVSPILIEEALRLNNVVEDCVVIHHERSLLAILFVPAPKDDMTLTLNLPLRYQPESWIVLQNPFPLTRRQKRSRQWIAAHALRHSTPVNRPPWRLISR